MQARCKAKAILHAVQASGLCSPLLCLPSPLFASDVSQVWDYVNSVEQYTAPGGTAKSSVNAQIEKLREMMEAQKEPF